MSFTFDGAERLVILSPGTVHVSLPDLYSRWKDWVRTADNAKWAPFFSTVGGESNGPGTVVPLYLFLLDGARVRLPESNGSLDVVGGVLVADGDPFADTLGNYRVRVRYSQPVQAIGYSTGAAPGLSESQVAGAVGSMFVEGDLQLVQALRLLLSLAAGNATGLDGAVTEFMSADGSTVRIRGTQAGGVRTITHRDGG